MQRIRPSRKYASESLNSRCSCARCHRLPSHWESSESFFSSLGTFSNTCRLFDFLTDTQWTVLFENPAVRHHAIGHRNGCNVGCCSCLLPCPWARPSRFILANTRTIDVREILKPILELLSAVPTVVFGYFALLFVTPLLQQVLPDLPGFNMLSAGIVIGIMIIPYVSSLSEDAMRAVPVHYTRRVLRHGRNPLSNGCPSSLPCCILRHRFGLCFGVFTGRRRNDGGGHRRRPTQPNLTLNPMEGAATITAFIVQVSLGDLPHGSIAYESIFAAGLTLMVHDIAIQYRRLLPPQTFPGDLLNMD